MNPIYDFIPLIDFKLFRVSKSQIVFNKTKQQKSIRLNLFTIK